jgi:hypothetical protein
MLDALRSSSMLHEHYNIDAIEPSHAASITAMRSQASAVGNFEHAGSLRRVNWTSSGSTCRSWVPEIYGCASSFHSCFFSSFSLIFGGPVH